MSVYRCNRCENYFDEDYQLSEIDPNDDRALICLGCAEDIACYDCGEPCPEECYYDESCDYQCVKCKFEYMQSCLLS